MQVERERERGRGVLRMLLSAKLEEKTPRLCCIGQLRIDDFLTSLTPTAFLPHSSQS